MFFLYTLVFIFGSAIGSFLNVVIDRTTRGESLMGRSKCDHCRATLSSVDLVPIVSFAVQSGRCRYCRRSLSWQYPLVEAITALLFTTSFYVLIAKGSFSFSYQLYSFFIVSILIIVAVVDFKFSLIPTTFVYVASLVALFYNFFLVPSSVFVDHVMAAFGASIFFLLIVVITRGRGMGVGDVILAFFIGMTLGARGTFVALFLAFLIGAAISVLLILFGRKRFGQTIPFAPFLVGGMLASFFWGEAILNWYLGIL